ncbi:glycoside hydrolase superfamily [Gilbertella persicaria]|uniref:glycoside hydrolase superfamily n=1 Tax=Gilbertella persicaria TaxID=101096 RepID=UPI00221E731E|nr:glycoside hydrolase superfamily [Gilbertella persicaria]KAI8053678.1 glycoside hydrolase superfamily [Gilbertella persicaria]
MTALALLSSKTEASFLDGPIVATYWGQNSKNGRDTQKRLSYYCNSDSDVILVSFLPEYHDGSLPVLNLADACDGPVFPGTNLLHCPKVGKDIKTCQKKGKTILLSLGGADGSYGFSNNANAEAFADTLWNLFGGGSSKTRPFDDAVLDGFDLDIEGGGSTGYAAMVRRLRSHFDKDSSKQYYITAAPQCPYPDAMLGKVINAVGMDAVFVQFYNNYCSATSNSFNFATWDKWAKNTSPNKNVKVFLGLPGSKQAAGSGYVPYKALEPIVKQVHSKYSSFGGVMIWDASEVYANKEVSPHYEGAIAKLVHGLKGTHSPTPTTTSRPSKPTDKPSTCPVQGAHCSNNGQYTCAGDAYAVCNIDKWVVSPCPGETTCFSTTNGNSVYCGTGSNEDTCELANNGLIESYQPELLPTVDAYESDHFTTQFSVEHVMNHEFSATINIRRLDNRQFDKDTMEIEFQVVDGIEIVSVDQGTVTQLGNQVKIQFPNTDMMSKVMTIKGRVHSEVFVAPMMGSFIFI